MEYAKDKMSLEEGIKREWIITNGLGGYCSSTIIGANTRKYHGLLVAPLTPPARRHLILSKLDESIQTDGKKYNLYTNMCKNYISDGYKYLQSFKKDYIPVFEYEVAGINIKKSICMEYRKNTVVLVYEIKNNDKDSILTLAPIMNLRDFHTVTANYEFDLRQNINKNKVKIVINRQSETPIYMNLTNGKYIKHENDKFNNMYYIEEEKRGMAAEENLIVPGRYEIELAPNEEKTITFVCSLEENIEEIDGKEIIKKEISRINKLIDKSNLLNSENEELVKTYIIASDNFVVYRPSFALYTIIAGYPWFLDWGRDSLISFEGLLLLSNRYEIAKEVLLTYIRDIKFGLVPNGYSGYDNRPLYNSADASLLLFEQVKKFLNYTKDYNFVEKNIYRSLIKVIESYINGINHDNNNIWLDKDGLLVAGTEHTQNTWMDAKVGEYCVTPRNGKAVEINAMWYNALKIAEELTELYGTKEQEKKYNELAEKCKKSFTEKFYNKRRKCLYDVIGDSKIRPNQLFAISLTYQVIEPNSEIATEMFETVTKKLLNDYGLKTLAKGEPFYKEVYEGDVLKRDMSYHQGITWPWLLGIYSDAYRNRIKAEKNAKVKNELKKQYENFRENVKQTFIKEMNENSTVGSISELYDSKKPYLAKGAFAQAWSVSEIFKIILQKG
ncbi:MAG: amylo-alpha-1,6-glucosidase [Clostridia bacterium]|jgi:predicted glycogen debranching enzyme|nr:glycogen debranching protein [Clostridia bacterium]MEE0789870.1 amylo-alpha-1,6-glucosidase [Clostridia bacterium]